jgi:hypothetical protein
VNDPLDRIWEGCYLCFRFMLRVSTTSTGCLQVKDGCYLLIEGARTYHPLEAVLVGEDAPTGDWKADVRTRLGVDAVWLDGFIDGFAQVAEQSTDKEYIQGFLAAEDLRERHPGLFRG